MSRSLLPFSTHDISAFARALNGQLAAHDGKPGHVELLNMLARSAGFRNYQHFRAQFDARDRLQASPPTPSPVDYVEIERAVRHFDAAGVMVRWPAKASHRQLCLWALWSRLPAHAVLSEGQISELLRALHSFGDHALLRRELFGRGFVTRTRDGREYRRVERRPPPEALSIIHALISRRAA